MPKKITVLKIGADHISCISQGKIQTLVVVNPRNISPLESGSKFLSVECTDHKMKHTMKVPVMVLDHTYAAYGTKERIHSVAHITFAKL